MIKQKVLLFALLLGIVASLSCGAQSRSEWVKVNNDSRAMAMGRTSNLNAWGPSAIFINPALIATLNGVQIEMGGRIGAGEIDNPYYDELQSSVKQRLTPLASFSHVAVTFPLKVPFLSQVLTAGFGYGMHFDFAKNYQQTTDFGEVSEKYELVTRGGFHVLMHQ